MVYEQLKLNTRRTLQQQELHTLRLKIIVISHKLLRFPMYVFTKPLSITLLTKDSLREKERTLRSGDRGGLEVRGHRPGIHGPAHLSSVTELSGPYFLITVLQRSSPIRR